MVKISLLAGELLLTALWILARAAVWLKNKHIDRKREAWLLLMYVNLAVIIRFVFYPFSRVGGRVQPLLFDAAAILPLRVNLIPLIHNLRFATRRDMLVNLIGNVALFIPSGIVFPILYPKLDGFWKTTAAGALLSLCLELAQLPFFTRATDVDDLILNTLGCALGYGLWALSRAAWNLRNRQKKGTQ